MQPTLQDTVNANLSQSNELAGFTTIPGQTQPEGTTGQMLPAPEQVVQPPQQPTQPIELEQPVQSPTVVSTDSMREQLQGAEQSLKDLQSQIAAGQVKPEQPQATVTPTPTTEGEVPSPTAFIDEYTKETNKILNERKNDFNRFLTRSDNLLKSQVRSIQQSFDVRRNQAEAVAANAKAATSVLGARTGRMRYAPEIQRGIMTGQENALITTLSEIDAMEAAAIAAAEGAAFNRDYGTFLDKIDSLDGIRKERETVMNELEEAMKEENERRKDEAETLRQETLIIEQFAAGMTDPVEIFQATNGEIPYDMIVQYTGTLPTPVSTEPVKLGSGDLLVNPTTGEIIARGSKVGGVEGNVSGAFSIGAPGVSVGAPTVEGLGATYSSSSDEAQMLIDDILNKVPTQLRNTEKEVELKKEQIRKQLQAGYSYQDIVDRLSGFSLQGAADKVVGNVLYNLALGTDVDSGALASLLNRGATEQAMTTVENAQLKGIDGFFAGTDKARATIAQAENVLSILNDPTFPKEKLGAFDGRSFKVSRFFGLGEGKATESGKFEPSDIVKIQQLESALQLLNAPIRVEIVGTAATAAEMSKITGFQADILDQPEIVQSMVSDLRDSVLRFHNQARSQRGLPQVTQEQVISNRKRLDLYRSLGKEEVSMSFSNSSNRDLLRIDTGSTQTTTFGGVPNVLDSLPEQ